MSTDMDQSKIETRKGIKVFGCLCLGILYVFQTIFYLITKPSTGDLIERVIAIIFGLIGLLMIVGFIVLLVKTRRLSYGLWCNNCSMFVDRKMKRCNICGNKKLLWKRIPR